jgi:cytidylate kinase
VAGREATGGEVPVYRLRMARTVICISHDTGAGGTDVAALVAEQLGFRLVDEEIVARAAEKQDVSAADLADVERRKSLLTRILADLGRGQVAMYGPAVPAADLPDLTASARSLRALIRQSIDETADEGDVVIVSHAASHALAGRDDVVRVLVTASTDTRVQRLAAAEALDEKQAKRSIEANDAGRAAYLKRFYGIGSESPAHYDVVVNTDRVTPDACAELIVRLASG